MREAGRSAGFQVQVSSNVWNPALADERWEKRYTARRNGIVLGRRGMELGIIRDSTQLGTHYSNDPTYTPWGIIKTWHYAPPWHYIPPLSLDNYYLLFISLPLFISTYISPSLPPISCELLSSSFFPPRPRGSYVIFFVPPHSYFLWGSFLSLSLSPISFSLSPFLSIYLSLSLSDISISISPGHQYNNGLFFRSFFPTYILHFHYVPHFHHHSFPLNMYISSHSPSFPLSRTFISIILHFHSPHPPLRDLRRRC